MTSPSEVIALEGAGAEPLIFKTNFKPKKQHLTHRPYFVDPAIVPRVKQYLEDNKDQVYVDIDEMVTALQRKYREYGKKKRPAFKGIVEKVVLKNYRMNDDELQNVVGSGSSSVSDMDVDSEDDLIVEPNNIMNNQVMNMYMQHQAMKKLSNVPDGAKELIDISSDDEDQVPAKRAKQSDSTNGSDPKLLPVSTPSKPQPSKAANGQATPKEVAVAQEQSHEKVQHVHNQTQERAAAGSATVATPAAPATPTVPERTKRKRQGVDGSGSSSASQVNADSARKKREIAVVHPCYSFKDVGGSTKVLQEVCKLLVHLRHPEVFEQIGVSPPRGFLLHGPPGCGKSLLANAIAGELGLPLLKVSAPELVAGVSGESEERIRDLFDQAVSIAPCVLFIDEIDAITPNRNNAQREMERRIVAQLLTTLDELSEKEGGNQVLVVGATNRPDSLDPALRRAGRFDREVCMGIPDREARAHILRVVCGRLALAPDVSSDAGIDELASLTPGFVGADLSALTREAAMVAVNRVFALLQEKEKDEGDTKPDLKETEQVSDSSESGDVSSKIEDAVAANAQEVEDTTQESETQKSTEPEAASGVPEAASGVPEAALGVPEAASGVPEEVNDKEGENQTALIEEENAEKKEEPEIKQSTVLEKPEVETLVVENEQPEKETQSSTVVIPSSADVIPSSSVENAELLPQEEDITESSQSENKKTDEDIEVLEVESVNNTDKSSEPEPLVPLLSDTSSTTEQSTVGKDEQKELALSQKLQPASIWSPQLCLLMSWLKDTPPLTTTQLSDLSITMADFHIALRDVQPSSKREGFATVPDVTWDDVGSLANVRAELQLSVLAPVRYAKQFSQLGLNAPTGVLLCGPPGCGKTLLAKAVANEAGINFISVKGPELLNMYVGESERAVRQVFQRARNSSPCVIFFDELDALCPKRSDSGDNGVSSRVVNQLLTEMDGVEGRSAVYLMAASNRPDIIDPAVLRPGRLDKIVYVGLPNAEDRKDILRALTKNGSRPKLASDIDFAELASRPQLEGFSGADLAALVREAGVHALREFIGSGADAQTGPLCVSVRHFNSAAAKIRPSVTGKDLKHYEKLKEMYGSTSEEGNSEVMDTA